MWRSWECSADHLTHTLHGRSAPNGPSLWQRDPAPASGWGKANLLEPIKETAVLTSCPGMLMRTTQDKSSLWLPWPRHPGVGGLRGQWVLGQGLTPWLVSDDSSSESGSGNGSSTLNPSTSSSTQGDPAFPEMNGNGAVAPMDFTTTTEDQPINLCDKLPPSTALGTPSYPSDGCSTDGLRSRVKYGVKSTPEVCGAAGLRPT